MTFELWVVAKQNPGRSAKMFLPKHTTSPVGLELSKRPPMEGPGYRFLVYEDEAGAVRDACNFSHELNRCIGIDFYLPVKIYLDGDMWCAVHRNFINLHESDAGFGETIEDAIEDLNIPPVIRSEVDGNG